MSLSRFVYYSAIIGGWAALAAWAVLEAVLLRGGSKFSAGMVTATGAVVGAQPDRHAGQRPADSRGGGSGRRGLDPTREQYTAVQPAVWPGRAGGGAAGWRQAVGGDAVAPAAARREAAIAASRAERARIGDSGQTAFAKRRTDSPASSSATPSGIIGQPRQVPEIAAGKVGGARREELVDIRHLANTAHAPPVFPGLTP
jgi:hypothetical protein